MSFMAILNIEIVGQLTQLRKMCLMRDLFPHLLVEIIEPTEAFYKPIRTYFHGLVPK